VLGGCEPDKSIVCHRADDKELEICISESALKGHIDHGDLQGPCAFEKTETKTKTMEAGTKIDIEFENEVVKKVSFKPKKDKKDAVVKAMTRATPPEEIKAAEGKVYNYIVIDHRK
jgi:hypothetical protein